jgi:integrase
MARRGEKEMARKITGLRLDTASGRWIIDKVYRGRRIFERTTFGAEEREKAEQRLFELLSVEKATRGPLTKETTFRDATIRYLNEYAHKRSIDRDSYAIERWDGIIGHLPLIQIHQGTIFPGIQRRREAGIKTGTLKREICVIQHILNLCSTDWRDEYGKPLLIAPPKLKVPDFEDKARPYILSREDDRRLLQELPRHLAEMALFGLQTGLRDRAIAGLRWKWFSQGRFVIPGRPDGTGWKGSKGKKDQVIVLNRVAWSIIESKKGQHETHVFTYEGKPVTRIYNTAWKRAWKAAGLPVGDDVLSGPHNLRHTYGRRLEELGVEFEVRQALLGHSPGKVTHIYSPVNLDRMQRAVDALCESEETRVRVVK